MKKSLFLSCVLVFVSFLSAQVERSSQQPSDWDTLLDAYKGEKINLPKDPALHLKSDVVVSQIDGLINREMFLRSDKIQFRSMVLRNWQPVTSPSKAASYSVLFVNRYEPDLKVGLKFYDKSAIPSGLNNDSIIGIYAGLRSKYQSRRFKILVPPADVRPTGYFSSLMSSPTFKTDFQFMDTGSQRTMLRNFSYYFTVENYMVVACIEGPANLVDINKETLDMLLQNLSVYTPEE